MSVSGSAGRPENWGGDTESEYSLTEDEDEDDDDDYAQGGGRRGSDDEGGSERGSDCDQVVGRSSLTEDQVRDEFLEREDAMEFLRANELENFVSKQQPDDVRCSGNRNGSDKNVNSDGRVVTTTAFIRWREFGNRVGVWLCRFHRAAHD